MNIIIVIIGFRRRRNNFRNFVFLNGDFSIITSIKWIKITNKIRYLYSMIDSQNLLNRSGLKSFIAIEMGYNTKNNNHIVVIKLDLIFSIMGIDML